MTGTSFSAGKICARLDYSSLSPVATGVSEVLQTSHGPFASCNISQAGDYIVLQLSYGLKVTAQEEYHDLPVSRGVWAPLLAKISTDPSSSVVWTWRLQLAAACLGVGFLLLFVCIVRAMLQKNKYEFFDLDEDEPMDDFTSGFDWQEGHLLTAFGTPSKGRRVDLQNQQGSSASDLLNTEECDSPASLHQDSIGALPGLNKNRKRWGSLVKAITAARLLQTGPKTKNISRRLFVKSLSWSSSGTHDTAAALSSGKRRLSVTEKLMAMDALRGRDSKGRTALHVAASKGDLTAVRALLDTEDGFSNPRHTDYRGQTPVHVAAKAGHDDIVADLVIHSYKLAPIRPPSTGSGRRRPFLVNQQDLDGNTPLHLAALSGHVAVIQALERTAESSTLDLGIENSNGWTPVQLAALNGHTEAVMKLVKLKPKAAFPKAPQAGSLDRDKTSLTPLHIASRHGHVKLVTCLLDWMKECGDTLDDDSLDGDDLCPEESGSSLSNTRTIAARSLCLLKNMASKSKKKLRTMILLKRPTTDVLDTGLEMSHFGGDDEQVEELLLSDDTQPLMLQRQIGTGPSDLTHDVVAILDEGAARPSMTASVNSTDAAAADGDGPGDATMPFASGDEGSCPMPSDTEILPASADDAASEKKDPSRRDSTPKASSTQGKAPAVRGRKAAATGSAGGPVPALKSKAVDLRKTRKPGIPMAAKPKPRVAAREPSSGSASGPGSSGKPGRSGQQGGGASPAGSAARGPSPTSGTKPTTTLHAKAKGPAISSAKKPMNAAGAAASRPLGPGSKARIQVPSKAAGGLKIKRSTFPAAKPTDATRTGRKAATAPPKLTVEEMAVEDGDSSVPDQPGSRPAELTRRRLQAIPGSCIVAFDHSPGRDKSQLCPEASHSPCSQPLRLKASHSPCAARALT